MIEHDFNPTRKIYSSFTPFLRVKGFKRGLKYLYKTPDEVGMILKPLRLIRSKTYIDASQRVWGEFYSWALSHPQEDLMYQIESFLHSLIERGLKHRTTLVYYIYLKFVMRQIAKSTGQFKNINYVEATNRLVTLPIPTKYDGRSRWLSEKEVEGILESPNKETLTGKRDIAILMLLVGMGLRSSEVGNLTWEQIERRDTEWVMKLKCKKRVRIIPMPEGCYRSIKAWGTPLPHSGTGFVFGYVRGHKIQSWSLSTRSIHAIVRNHSDIANPRALRRTFVQHAWLGGMDLLALSRYLGHSHPRYTEEYLGDGYHPIKMQPTHFLSYADSLG